MCILQKRNPSSSTSPSNFCSLFLWQEAKQQQQRICKSQRRSYNKNQESFLWFIIKFKLCENCRNKNKSIYFHFFFRKFNSISFQRIGSHFWRHFSFFFYFTKIILFFFLWLFLESENFENFIFLHVFHQRERFGFADGRWLFVARARRCLDSFLWILMNFKIYFFLLKWNFFEFIFVGDFSFYFHFFTFFPSSRIVLEKHWFERGSLTLRATVFADGNFYISVEVLFFQIYL